MKTIAAAAFLAFFANGQQQPVDPAFQAALAAVGTELPPPPAGVSGYQCNGWECYGRILNVPAVSGWSFECVGHCEGMVLNLEAGYDAGYAGQGRIVDYIDSISCKTPRGCAGMTINVANSFCDPANPTLITRQVEINDLRCEGPGACDGMTVNAQCGVDIMKTNFDCQQPGTCVGCIVRDAFELKSCDQNQNPNGAMTMPWEVAGLGIPAPAYANPASQMPMLPAYTFKTQAGLPMNANGVPGFQPVPQAIPQPAAPAQPATPVEPAQPAAPAQPAQPANQGTPVYYPYPQYQGQQPLFPHYV